MQIKKMGIQEGRAEKSKFVKQPIKRNFFTLKHKNVHQTQNKS